jgi:PAS domain S-box-containing protein
MLKNLATLVNGLNSTTELYHHFAAIVESSDDAIVSKDLNGTIRSWNTAAERIFGHSASEAIGQPVTILIPPDRLDEEQGILSRIRRGEKIDHYETIRHRKDGSLVNISLTISPIKAEDGTIIGASTIARDITESKRIEEKLNASESRLAKELKATRLLQDLSTLMIRGVNLDFMHQRIVDTAAAIMQSDMASLEGINDATDTFEVLASKGCNQLCGPALEWNGLNSTSSCSKASRTGHRMVVPDIEKSDFLAGTPALERYRKTGIRSLQSTLLRSRSGRVIGMLSTHWLQPRQPVEGELRLMDLLARQAADLMERAQTDISRARLAAIVEFSDDAILSKDLNGIITSWNRGAERLFGYSAQEAVGRSVTMLMPPDRLNEEPIILERIRRGESVEHYETIRRRKDGTLFNISLTVSPIKDADGRIIGASKIARDITERKSAENIVRNLQHIRASELGRLVDERTASLQETVAELEHFSYTITHDMRAPLRAMRGFGSILLSKAGERLTSEEFDYLRRIMDAASRMDALILDSLQYARVVREHMPLARVDPAPVLNGILESYPALQPAQAQIHVLEPLPAVMANAAGLGQCFSNLLANAIKFVRPGENPRVRIWAETRSLPATSGHSSSAEATKPIQQSINPNNHQSNGNGYVRFWFEDNGIGIHPKYHERIFGMFQQLDKRYEGTGVGLALVRKTAERMEGKVGVESEPGQGSRFWLEFKSAKLPVHSPPVNSNVATC